MLVGEIKKFNVPGMKTISADDEEYLPSNPDLKQNPLELIGAELQIPMQRLRIVTTDFERSGYFPEAIALVEIIEGSYLESGDHLKTPWGVVRIK